MATKPHQQFRINSGLKEAMMKAHGKESSSDVILEYMTKEDKPKLNQAGIRILDAKKKKGQK
jgi:predicted CopG family antitoxin